MREPEYMNTWIHALDTHNRVEHILLIEWPWSWLLSGSSSNYHRSGFVVIDLGCPTLVASLPERLHWASGPQHPKDSTTRRMQTQPTCNSPHSASLLWCFLFSACIVAEPGITHATWRVTELSGDLMQRSIVADLPTSHLGMRISARCVCCASWPRLLSVSSCAPRHARWQNSKRIQRMGHASGTKLTLTHRKA